MAMVISPGMSMAATSKTPHVSIKLPSVPVVGVAFKVKVSVRTRKREALLFVTDPEGCPATALAVSTQLGYAGAISQTTRLRYTQNYTVAPMRPNETTSLCAYLFMVVKGGVVGPTVARASVGLVTGTTGPATVTE